MIQGFLPGDERPSSLRFGHESEILPGQSGYRQDWYLRTVVGPKHNPCPDKLRLPQRVIPIRNACLHQYGLRRVVHLRRNEAHLCIGHDSAFAVEYLQGQIHFELA